MLRWGEEEKRLFASPRNVCQNFSLALNVEKKRFEFKFLERRVVLWQVAVVVGFRKNFK
jgi:hypothetical protein